MRNLPGSPSFSGNLFRRTAKQYLFNEVLESSQSLSLPRSTNWRSYRLRDKLRDLDFRIFSLGHRRLDVFSASVANRMHCVLSRLGFIFHHLRKKRRWRLKNPPSKHFVFEEPELGKQELGKLEVGKPRVDKQEQEENQEVELDLTSSEDDTWRKELGNEFQNKIIPSKNRSRRSDLVEISNVSMQFFFVMSKKLLVLNK
nr:hypothetical protein [Tanacetum cinerariifolium]